MLRDSRGWEPRKEHSFLVQKGLAPQTYPYHYDSFHEAISSRSDTTVELTEPQRLGIIGNGGCNLRVSFTTTFKYLSSCTLLISTFIFPFKLHLTSSCTFAITRGFLISSAIAQSTVVDDVSVPAENVSFSQ